MDKTRCKPGDRAKVIRAMNPENIGLIVCVIRMYEKNEVFDDATWSTSGTPWAVASIGKPLVTTHLKTLEKTDSYAAVFDDSCLVPLDDNDNGLTATNSRKRKTPKREGLKYETHQAQ